MKLALEERKFSNLDWAQQPRPRLFSWEENLQKSYNLTKWREFIRTLSLISKERRQFKNKREWSRRSHGRHSETQESFVSRDSSRSHFKFVCFASMRFAFIRLRHLFLYIYLGEIS